MTSVERRKITPLRRHASTIGRRRRRAGPGDRWLLRPEVRSASMSDSPAYRPPKVWTWNQGNGGQFRNQAADGGRDPRRKGCPWAATRCSSTRSPRPTGEGHRRPRGAARAGHPGAEYDAWLIKIGEGEQFGSGFVEVNPNSKIPALLDRSGTDADPRVRVRRDPPHLAEKFGALRADGQPARAPSASRGCSGRWAAAPYLGGGFGHFYNYAPEKIEYAIDRFAMEMKRQLDVLDRRLEDEPNTSPVTSTRSPTSPCGPGTARS